MNGVAAPDHDRSDLASTRGVTAEAAAGGFGAADGTVIRRTVESRKGAVSLLATRFPSPLIKPDVRISRIRLSDWLRGCFKT